MKKKVHAAWQSVRRFWKDEEGLGTLEIILIIAIIVIIVIAFRKWIFHWIEKLFEGSNKSLNELDNPTQINTGTDG